MQYEAKNVGGVATSQSGGTPWVNISQVNAITACSNLGSGYHLITNQEWMLLANDIASVANNWTSGIVGQGLLVRGNSNGSAALDGSAPGTIRTTNYRIHTLTNGFQSGIWLAILLNGLIILANRALALVIGIILILNGTILTWLTTKNPWPVLLVLI